jgi:hemerythrin
MNVRWTPALSVGVERIDAQHRELFARLDALLTALAEARGPEEVFGTLSFLGEYVSTHFLAEEALMQHVGYPGADAHVVEHESFIGRFRRLRSLFARGGADASLAGDVKRELADWLTEHVCGTDRALAEFVRAQPTSIEPSR